MDFAHRDRQRLIRPRLLDVLWEFLTQPPDDCGLIEDDDHLCGIDPDRDYLDTQRRDAIAKLGRCWRGRPDAQHQYINSLGVKTNPAALTENNA